MTLSKPEYKMNLKTLRFYNSSAGILLLVLFTFHLELPSCTASLITKRHIRGYDQNTDSNSTLFEIITNNFTHSSEDATCTTVSSYDEVYSKCVHVINKEKLNIVKSNINKTLHGEFWCACENHPCSLIYKVEDGTKVKNVYLTGFVDNKAEIVILAEYSSDKGEFFPIGRLHGYEEVPQALKRIKFDYFHEGFLDMSTLNVTIILNGGFSLIEDFVVIVEDRPSVQVQSTPAPITPKVITLDHDEDALQDEWIEITCHYSDFFEDFWAYGCPVNADANFMPSSIGYWFPCHESFCAFTYDGISHNRPIMVVIDGYMQGGSIEVAGKKAILDNTPWRTLGVQAFHNSTLYQLSFDLLKDDCDFKVLQVTINADKDSVIIIDKISVHLDQFASSVSGNKCTVVSETEETEETVPKASVQSSAFKVEATYFAVLSLLVGTFIILL